MITYKEILKGVLVVYLDNKRVGEIVKVRNGFQYYAQGKKKYAGETFPTLNECKRSLEED